MFFHFTAHFCFTYFRNHLNVLSIIVFFVALFFSCGSQIFLLDHCQLLVNLTFSAPISQKGIDIFVLCFVVYNLWVYVNKFHKFAEWRPLFSRFSFLNIIPNFLLEQNEFLEIFYFELYPYEEKSVASEHYFTNPSPAFMHICSEIEAF